MLPIHAETSEIFCRGSQGQERQCELQLAARCGALALRRSASSRVGYNHEDQRNTIEAALSTGRYFACSCCRRAMDALSLAFVAFSSASRPQSSGVNAGRQSTV